MPISNVLTAALQFKRVKVLFADRHLAKETNFVFKLLMLFKFGCNITRDWWRERVNDEKRLKVEMKVQGGACRWAKGRTSHGLITRAMTPPMLSCSLCIPKAYPIVI